MGGDKGMRGWLTYLQEHLLTLNVRGAKGESSLDRFLQCSRGSGEEGVGEDASMTIQSFPTSLQLSFFLPDAMVA